MHPIPTRAAIAVLLALSLKAQEPLVTATRNEVVLDIVARDRKGRAIRDLEPANFHVTDDGAPVSIASFRLIERGARNAKLPAAATDAARLDPLKQIQLVTLVFERLGQEGRILARQAALDLLKGEPEQNVYYAVFTIDQRLAALQQFTNDRALLRKAVEKGTSGAYTAFASDSEQIRRNLESQIGAGPGPEGQGTVERIQNMPDSGYDPSARLMAQMMLNMLQFDESMSIQQQGRSSIFALLSLVREQFRLPGRKTLMYFSEGLVVPENLDEPFRSVISAANRANVSVYAVDSRGLQTTRQNLSSIDALKDAAASSKSAVTKTEGAVTLDEAKALDKGQASTRLNVQNSLAELSESTGGFLIANSNDLRNPLRRVAEDLETYYELSYVPSIERYDGHFRKIAVKVDRPDIHLQSRNGYFALPPDAGPTLFPYEVPMLAALAKPPFPHAFDFHSAALRFQPSPAGARCALVIEVPLKNISFIEDQPRGLYRTHFSVLGIVKDATGAVVRKFSQDIPFQGPLDKMAAFQSGKFIYTNHFDAPAGRYTLETAVLDREGSKLSARKAVFVLARPAPGVSLSSIALVRRFDPQASPEDGDPFQFQGGKVTPTLESGIAGGKGSMVSLYFVIYPDAQSAEKPRLWLQFYSGDKLVAQASPELPAPDKNGRIPYIASSPAEAMQPGQYEVRAVVKQGASAREERTLFTIE